MSGRATRFRLLGLPASDPAGLAAFYRDVLGLAATPIPHGVEVAAGATALNFLEAEARPVAPVHFAFNVPAGSLAGIAAALPASLPLLADEQGRTRFAFPSWRAEAIYARDPAGNILEWIAREEIGAGEGAAFGPTSILGVSEVAVTVPDVPEFVRAVTAATGLAAYGNPSEEFAAVGDARGLLIVMRAGRLVFPERREPAHAVPTFVTCETNVATTFDWPAGRLRLLGET